jgi:hypothetical protein
VQRVALFNKINGRSLQPRNGVRGVASILLSVLLLEFIAVFFPFDKLENEHFQLQKFIITFVCGLQ